MKKKNSWFRMYAEVLDDPKVQRLSGDLFKCWVNLLCMACKNDGLVNVADFSFGLRINDKKAEEVLSAFVAIGLIEIVEEKILPHNWDGRQFLSDNSTDRSQRCRERQKSVSGNDDATVDATPLQRCMQRQQDDSATVKATPPETETETETEKKKKKEPPISPDAGITRVATKGEKAPGQRYAPEFEQFWAAFPRKISKGAAYKAWNKEKPPLDACLQTLAWQTKTLEWTKDSGQFIPHPSTWLNARGWENQPLQPVPPPKRVTRFAY